MGVRFSQPYISSSWVEIRLHTESQLPRLSACAFVSWGCDYHCFDCDRVKTKSTPSLLTKDLDGI